MSVTRIEFLDRLQEYMQKYPGLSVEEIMANFVYSQWDGTVQVTNHDTYPVKTLVDLIPDRDPYYVLGRMSLGPERVNRDNLLNRDIRLRSIRFRSHLRGAYWSNTVYGDFMRNRNNAMQWVYSETFNWDRYGDLEVHPKILVLNFFFPELGAYTTLEDVVHDILGIPRVEDT